MSDCDIHDATSPLTLLKTQDPCLTSSITSLCNLLLSLTPSFGPIHHYYSVRFIGVFHHSISPFVYTILE